MSLLFGASLLSSSALAAEAKDFFVGKTITYIVATKTGGGYDRYARLIAEFMEKHIEGVGIRVINVPGAGHLVGANRLSVAPADGLTIGTFNTGLIYAQMLGRPGLKFDLNGLSWIGKAASDPKVFVIGRQSSIDSIRGLRERAGPILLPSAGVGSASHTEILLLSHALGFDVKIVPGFSGSEAELSVLRGEMNGIYGSFSSPRPFVEDRNGAFLFHVGGTDEIPDGLPSASDLALDDGGRRVVATIEKIAGLARLTAAPGGVPPGRLAVLRAAYRDALADPELLERAGEWKIPIDPLIGDDVAEWVRSILSAKSGIRAIVSSAIGKAGAE
jgi:tripartite-type tricarboxylate transporter receptor subunit TctC